MLKKLSLRSFVFIPKNFTNFANITGVYFSKLVEVWLNVTDDYTHVHRATKLLSMSLLNIDQFFQIYWHTTDNLR